MNSRTAPSRKRNKKTNKQRASTRQKHAGPRQEALRRHCGPPLQPRTAHPCGTLSPPSLRPHCSPPIPRNAPPPLRPSATPRRGGPRNGHPHTAQNNPIPRIAWRAPRTETPALHGGAARLARATHGSPLPAGRGQRCSGNPQKHPQGHTAHPCRRPLVIPSAPRLAPFLGGRRPQRYARLAPADTASCAFLRPRLCIPPPRAAVFRGARTASAQHTVLLRNLCESLPLFSGWQNFFLGTFTRVWGKVKNNSDIYNEQGDLGDTACLDGCLFQLLLLLYLCYFQKGIRNYCLTNPTIAQPA